MATSPSKNMFSEEQDFLLWGRSGVNSGCNGEGGLYLLEVTGFSESRRFGNLAGALKCTAANAARRFGVEEGRS